MTAPTYGLGLSASGAGEPRANSRDLACRQATPETGPLGQPAHQFCRRHESIRMNLLNEPERAMYFHASRRGGCPKLPIACQQDPSECQRVVEAECVGVAEARDTVRLRGGDPRQLRPHNNRAGRPQPSCELWLVRVVDLRQDDVEHFGWRQTWEHLDAVNSIEVDQDTGVGEQCQAGAPSSQRLSSSRTTRCDCPRTSAAREVVISSLMSATITNRSRRRVPCGAGSCPPGSPSRP